MSAVQTQSGYTAVYTTEPTAGRDAFESWHALIKEKFRSSAEPPPVRDGFEARMACSRFTGFTMATMTASEHRTRRTKRLISQDDPEYFMASVMVSGSGYVEQEGRVAQLKPGDVTCWDTTQPSTLQFDSPFEIVLLRLSHDHARRYAPLRRLQRATAVTLPSHGTGKVLSGYFTGLASLAGSDPVGAQALAGNGAALLTSALTLAANEVPEGEPARELRREQVLAYLRANLADPCLDTTKIAQANQLSRRALYRLFEEDGQTGGSVMDTLRWLRVDQARQLLTAFPDRNVRMVGKACGFGSEVQFHRAFKQLTGTTPGQYRAEARLP
jgi:AraC-like DNA-binding protein